MNSGKIHNGLHQIFSPITALFSRKTRLVLILAIMTMAAFSASVIGLASSGDKHEKKSSDHEAEVTNFGKVTDNYFRGAQPREDEYANLAKLGVKTIIDLRDDPKDYAKSMTEQLGMKYINFPLSDKSYPAPDVAEKFLSLVNDKDNQPVYVHCAGGRHRTGAMTAVFRMKMQGWDIERAYEEMKSYDFYTRWGHKDMKKFVFDYYKDLLVSQKREKKNPSSLLGGENSLDR
ncbi:MAG TPA: tyrosine-protein phosphatase [Blastocatellia bacterium]|nr:tyrosine-protein phosphatase [Blastocatellia bacterium]